MGLGAAVLAACAPALDWRDVRPPGSALRVQLPCRPAVQQRQVALAGPPVALTLHVCTAAQQTWGLAQADVVDPARVRPALAALMAAAAANIGAERGAPSAATPLAVPGATPNGGSGRAAWSGRLPDGQPVQMASAVFVHGTQVFQATVLGQALDPAAVQLFFDSIRFSP